MIETLLDCAGVSVSADTQKNKRAVKQGTSKIWQEEAREEPVSIFLNTSVHLLPEKNISDVNMSNVKTSNVLVQEGFTMLDIFVRL